MYALNTYTTNPADYDLIPVVCLGAGTLEECFGELKKALPDDIGSDLYPRGLLIGNNDSTELDIDVRPDHVDRVMQNLWNKFSTRKFHTLRVDMLSHYVVYTINYVPGT